jgi:predicted ABC-class ATPase
MAPRSSAIGAGDHGAEIERHQALVAQGLRHVAVDDALGQALDDRGLADAGLADQNRIVFGAAGQHLDGAANFLVPPDHRVEFTLPRHRGQVAGILFEGVVALFGAGAVCGAAFAQVVDRLVQLLGRELGVGENPRRRRAVGKRQGQ